MSTSELPSWCLYWPASCTAYQATLDRLVENVNHGLEATSAEGVFQHSAENKVLIRLLPIASSDRDQSQTCI